MGDECSVWFNTVLRGDVNSIRIGNRVNIQDGSVLHTLYQKSTIEIGDDVSIGHNVTIHGAKIHDFALIGMGAVVMDDAEVGEGALVAAGSVVLSRTKIGPNELWGARRPNSSRWSTPKHRVNSTPRLPAIISCIPAGIPTRRKSRRRPEISIK